MDTNYDDDFDQESVEALSLKEEESTRGNANTLPSVSPRSDASSQRSTPLRPPRRQSLTQTRQKEVLNNSLFTYSIQATRIRGLKIPTASKLPTGVVSGIFPKIRELRIFANLDKQPNQSLGSKWKQEPIPESTTSQSLAKKNSPSKSSKKSPNKSTLSRHSGFIEEGIWKYQDGLISWDLDLEKFRKLKAYSPKIKVFVYGIQANKKKQTNKKEENEKNNIISFGWFFLDLRTPDIPDKWLKIQNSSFGGEVYVRTSFLPYRPAPTQNVQVATVPTPKLNDINQPVRSSVNRTALPLASYLHRPSRDEDDGDTGDYLRLGTRQNKSIYVFSIFIEKGSDLLEVVQKSLVDEVNLDELRSAGFWLSYSLFDVVVQSDVFHGLKKPEFSSIRDNFRVLSSIEDLKDFFNTNPSLTVYLCTLNRVLGSAEIPLRRFLSSQEFLAVKNEEDFQASTVEGKWKFEKCEMAEISASVSLERRRTLENSHKGSTFFQRQGIVMDDEEKYAEENDDYEEDFQEEEEYERKREEKDDGTLRSSQPVSKQNLSRSITVEQLYLKHSKALLHLAAREGIRLEISLVESMSGNVLSQCMETISFDAHKSDAIIGGNDKLQIDLNLNIKETVTLTLRCFSSVGLSLIASGTKEIVPSLIFTSKEEFFEIPLETNDGQKNLAGVCSFHIGALNEKAQVHSLNTSMEDEMSEKHHFRFFLQLKSLRDFESSQEVELQYKNPFSGRGTISSDTVQVKRKAEVLVGDHSSCIFEIFKSKQALKKLMETPLVVQAITTTSNHKKTVGTAVFSLNFLFLSQENQSCGVQDCGKVFRTTEAALEHVSETHPEIETRVAPTLVHPFKSCSIHLPIMNGNIEQTSPRRLGTVELVAYLEDLGKANNLSISDVVPSTFFDAMLPFETFELPIIKEEKRTDTTRFSKPLLSSLTEESSNQTTRVNFVSSDVNNELLSSQEADIVKMKQAITREREQWKEEQRNLQKRWETELSEAEKARMDLLEEAWARREEERSDMLLKSQRQYQHLEQKLRSTLKELETRERKLSAAESAFQQTKKLHDEELDFLKRKYQKDHTHAVSLAEQKVATLEKRLRLSEEQLKAAEQRTKTIEYEFQEYRQQQRKLPESKLKEENATLKGTLSEVEKQKVVLEQANEQLKTQAANLERQLSQLAQLVQKQQQSQLKEKADEMEKLRLKYIAREEKFVLDGDRQELRAIKQQLEDLRTLSIKPRKSKRQEEKYKTGKLSSGRKVTLVKQDLSEEEFLDKSNSDSGKEEKYCEDYSHELKRLQRERELLIKSGAYTDESYLVRELDRMIFLTEEKMGH